MKRTRFIILSVVACVLVIAIAVLLPRGAGSAIQEGLHMVGTPAERDMQAIAVDTLRVLVVEDPLVWEQRIKTTSGLEFELLERFARSEKIPIVAIPLLHPDSLFTALWRGDGDIVAAQCVDRKDLKDFAFTRPYGTVEPVLASLRMDPIARHGEGDVLRPSLDSVHIARWSPFADPGYRFDRTFESHFPAGSDTVLTEDELLADLVIGRYAAIIVSDLRAAHEAARLPTVAFGDPVGPAQKLRFIVRPNAKELRKRLDAWLDEEKEQEARAQLVKSYAAREPSTGPLRARRPAFAKGDSISPFDDYFREHATGIAWDWQLLAAMAWKETRFDSTVVSRQGAEGIMQLMPRTSAKLGLDSSAVMDDHIRVAARYLSKLDTLWRRAVPDPEQRLRFVLASYNAGPGHIIDAQRLAERLGLDPQRWEHNVESAVLLLAKPRFFLRPEMKNGFCNGRIVFHYVRDIVAIYDQLRARERSGKQP